jgi:ABC-type multidrug transport system fused ATPase/permease subunit
MVLPLTYILVERDAGLPSVVQDYLVDSDIRLLSALGSWLLPRIPIDPFRGIVLVMSGVVALAIVSSAGRFLHGVMIARVVQRVMRRHQNRMHRRLVRAPLWLMLQTGPHEMVTRALADVDALTMGFHALFSRALQKALRGGAAMALAFCLNWWISLSAMVAVPAIVLLLALFARLIRRTTRAAFRQRERMVERLDHMMRHIRVVKVQTAEGQERRRFNRATRDLERDMTRLRQLPALAKPLVTTLTIVGMTCMVLVAAWLIFRRNVPAAEFMTVLALLGTAGAALQSLMNVHQQFHESSVSAQRVLEVMKLPVEPIDDHSRPALPKHHQSVRFDAVSFTYAKKDRPAIGDVSLNVPFGTTVAIVGPNGCGKSTLLALLPRLLEPAAGRVLIDDRDIADVSLRSLRKQIAVVPQTTATFDGTFAQNIAYGSGHASMAKIVAAGKSAGADEVAATLPSGYDTMLGRDGVGLSGGEVQRLAIARAVLRDPAILILDEATSQVDADSESRINLLLRDRSGARTTFVIAHRLSTVIHADLIVVMEAGRIVDSGTHAELIERCGAYRGLTEPQMAGA